MTSSRDTVLATIRAAIAGDAAPPPIPRDYLRSGDHPPGSAHVVDLLTDRLVDYKAIVDRVTPGGLPRAVEGALAGLAGVVVAPGLNPAVVAACAGDLSAGPARNVMTDSAPTPLTPQELDSIDAVVTTARVAIALTGTIVLDGGPGQGRRAITLVPDRHVIILTADQIVETVAEAISLLTPTAALTMIAGPSATSDIELERVEGVHGPRTLHVIILE